MAGKNEAKIKFTAETGGFNEAIKKSNDELSMLRAAFKLNETQMKTTGATVEKLQEKHRILSEELSASQDKTEALTQKVQRAVEIYGKDSKEVSKLKVQLLNAQNAEEKIKQAINACNEELEEQARSSNKTKTATEQLTDSIDEQQSKLDDVKRAYKNAVLTYGENSREAEELGNEIENLSTELKKNKDEMESASAKADKLDKSLDDAGNSADDAGGGFTVLKGVIADLASKSIQTAIGKIAEFVGYLSELPSATLELRQDLSTLTTSFEGAGLSTKNATETWKDLFAVFGEDDRAVETANNISKVADNQKELNDWVEIATGIWGTYQDALPVENIAEAAMETSRTGTVTSGLADALNWSSKAAEMFSKYMGGDVVTAEDAFNEALKECTSEQERQQLITDTLTELYGDAANTYRETAKTQMEAKEASAEHMKAEAELAETIEPVTTEFTNFKTQMLEGVKPAVEKVSGAILEFTGWMKEHPKTVKAVGASVATLAIGLGGLAIAAGIYTAAQWAMNAAVLANPITWIAVGIVAAIAALVGAGVALYQNWDKIREKAKQLYTDVLKKFHDLKTGVQKKINELKTGAVNKFNEMKTGAIDKITSLKTGAVNKFHELKTGALDKITSLKTGAINKFNEIKNGITSKIEGAKSSVKNTIDKIKGLFKFSWSLPKLKVPKVSVDGGKAPWGIAGKGRLPSFSVSWHALGAVFKKPTLLPASDGLHGVGEAGAEAVLPLSALQGFINRAFERNIVSYATNTSSGDTYNLYLDHAVVNSSEEMKAVAKDFITNLVRLGGMNR